MKKKHIKKALVNVRLSPKLKKRLQERAEKEGEAAAVLIRLAIIRYLDNVTP